MFLLVLSGELLVGVESAGNTDQGKQMMKFCIRVLLQFKLGKCSRLSAGILACET